jgi:hydroxyquinol 1,2-dioxygenase
VPLTTHLFASDSPYLDSDAVFGVRDSLIVHLPQARARHGPGRPRDGQAFPHREAYDFACPSAA